MNTITITKNYINGEFSSYDVTIINEMTTLSAKYVTFEVYNGYIFIYGIGNNLFTCNTLEVELSKFSLKVKINNVKV